MFYNCISLTGISDNFIMPLSIKDLTSTFENCKSFTTLPQKFTLRNCYDVLLNYTFKNCINLSGLHQSFEMPIHALGCIESFCSCKNLSGLTSTFILPESIIYQGMFKNCDKLTGLPVEHQNYINEYNENVQINFYNTYSDIDNSIDSVVIHKLTEVSQLIYTICTNIFENNIISGINSQDKILTGTITISQQNNSVSDNSSNDIQNYISNIRNTYYMDLSSEELCNILKTDEKLKEIISGFVTKYTIISLTQQEASTDSTSLPEDILLINTIIPSEIYSIVLNYIYTNINNLDYKNIYIITGQIFGEFKLSENTIDIENMFKNCSSLITIPDTFVFPNTLVDMNAAFAECINLEWNWTLNNPWPEYGIIQIYDEDTGYIQSIHIEGGFTNKDSDNADGFFIETFKNCKKIQGDAPGQILWKLCSDKFLELDGNVIPYTKKDYIGLNCFAGCTSLNNYMSIPKFWGGDGLIQYGPYWAALEFTITEPNTEVTIQHISQLTKKESGQHIPYFINWNNQASGYIEFFIEGSKLFQDVNIFIDNVNLNYYADIISDMTQNTQSDNAYFNTNSIYTESEQENLKQHITMDISGNITSQKSLSETDPELTEQQKKNVKLKILNSDEFDYSEDQIKDIVSFVSGGIPGYLVTVETDQLIPGFDTDNIFEGSTPLTTPSASHIFETPGTYIVTLQEIASFKVGLNNTLTDIYFLGYNLNTCEQSFASSLILSGFKYDWSLPTKSYNCSGMFKNCTSLIKMHDNFNLTFNNTNIDSMFENCTSLTGINSLFKLNEYNIKSCENLYKDCTSLTYIHPEFLLPTTTKSYKGMFDNCISLSALPEQFILPANTENIAYMFRNSSITGFINDFTLPVTLKDASEAFRNMQNLSIDINQLINKPLTNTRNIDFYMTFKDTPGLTGIVNSNYLWNTDLHFTTRQCFKNSGVENLSDIPYNWGGTADNLWHPQESVFTITPGLTGTFNFSNISGKLITQDFDDTNNSSVKRYCCIY